MKPMKNLLLMIHILNEQGYGERIDAMLNDIESKIKVETDSSIAEYLSLIHISEPTRH